MPGSPDPRGEVGQRELRVPVPDARLQGAHARIAPRGDVPELPLERVPQVVGRAHEVALDHVVDLGREAIEEAVGPLRQGGALDQRRGGGEPLAGRLEVGVEHAVLELVDIHPEPVALPEVGAQQAGVPAQLPEREIVQVVEGHLAQRAEALAHRRDERHGPSRDGQVGTVIPDHAQLREVNRAHPASRARAADGDAATKQRLSRLPRVRRERGHQVEARVERQRHLPQEAVHRVRQLVVAADARDLLDRPLEAPDRHARSVVDRGGPQRDTRGATRDACRPCRRAGTLLAGEAREPPGERACRPTGGRHRLGSPQARREPPPERADALEGTQRQRQLAEEVACLDGHVDRRVGGVRHPRREVPRRRAGAGHLAEHRPVLLRMRRDLAHDRDVHVVQLGNRLVLLVALGRHVGRQVVELELPRPCIPRRSGEEARDAVDDRGHRAALGVQVRDHRHARRGSELAIKVGDGVEGPHEHVRDVLDTADEVVDDRAGAGSFGTIGLLGVAATESAGQERQRALAEVHRGVGEVQGQGGEALVREASPLVAQRGAHENRSRLTRIGPEVLPRCRLSEERLGIDRGGEARWHVGRLRCAARQRRQRRDRVRRPRGHLGQRVPAPVERIVPLVGRALDVPLRGVPRGGGRTGRSEAGAAHEAMGRWFAPVDTSTFGGVVLGVTFGATLGRIVSGAQGFLRSG